MASPLVAGASGIHSKSTICALRLNARRQAPAAPHSYACFASARTFFAMRKQSTPTGTPQ
jgi:hypothetical protein